MRENISFELESHVHDHGHGYQQGSGYQYNIERAYLNVPATFDVPATLSARLFSSDLGLLVCESDPLELGVHRAAILNGNAVPEYVPRDIDADVSKSITTLSRSGGLLIIVGDSTAGKSRAAYEALLRLVPNYRLIAPYDRAELRDALAYVAVAAEKVILWLDDIERFLGGDGFTARIASQLKRIGVISIGTIRTEQYRSLNAFSASDSSADSKEPRELLAFEHVLKQAELIFMERRWSATEKERAAEAKDSRVAEALKHDNVYGIAEYLAAGPRLYEEWRLAWEVGENPRGAALVSTAIDCYRAGLRGAVPLETLRATHEYYLDVAGGPLLRPEPFEHALSWATRRRYGVTSLLLPTIKPQMYRAFDYLIDKVATADDAKPVPDVIWQAVRQCSGENRRQLNQIAIAASSQAKNELAESIWRENAEAGSSTSAKNLGKFLVKLDRDEEAELWFERAVELGDLTAAISLGHLLQYKEQNDKAAVWYERAALSDDPHGMYHMGVTCRNKGDREKAERWFRKALERNDKLASSGLGELLVSSGRLEEAETFLRAAADEGDILAIAYLGNVLDDLGRVDEAEKMWLRAAGLGSAAAKANLGAFYARSNRYSESERWFTEAVADGTFDDIYGPFSVVLVKRHKWNQAETMAEKAMELGDMKSALYFGQALLGENRPADAEKWFRIAVDAGDEEAVRRLAWTLERSERSADAEPYWRRLAEKGDRDATFALAMIELDKGDLDAAVPLFENAAASGDEIASCELAQIYRQKHDGELTEKWLLKSFADGHIHAACNLGHFYYYRQAFDKAEEYWIHAYNGDGHAHAANYLSNLLAGLGRGQDAAMWLRRADGNRARGPSRKRKRSRKKSRR